MEKIEHIFNEVKSDNSNRKDIFSQEFTGKFWVNRRKGYSSPKRNLYSDFAKLYYYGLIPSDGNNLISKYDDEKIARLKDKLGNIYF